MSVDDALQRSKAAMKRPEPRHLIIEVDGGGIAKIRVTEEPNGNTSSSLYFDGAFAHQSIYLAVVGELATFFSDHAETLEARSPDERIGLWAALDRVVDSARQQAADAATSSVMEKINSDDFLAEHARRAREQFQRERALILETLIERDGDKCRICGSTDALSIDHDIPVTKGGTNELHNLLILCQSCNARKGNRPHLQVIRGDR